MIDSSGNGRSGTYSGVTLGTAGLIPGDSDKAITCASTPTATKYGYVAGAGWMNPSLLTVAIWMSTTDSAQADKTMMSRWDQTTAANCQFGLDLGSSTSQAARWFVRVSSATYIAEGAAALNDGKRHYVVGVFNGTQAILYVDGSAVATTAASGTLNNPASTRLVVGGIISNFGAVNTNYGFTGTLDEAAVYGSAFTASDVLATYRAAMSNGVALGMGGYGG